MIFKSLPKLYTIEACWPMISMSDLVLFSETGIKSLDVKWAAVTVKMPIGARPHFFVDRVQLAGHLPVDWSMDLTTVSTYMEMGDDIA